MTKEMMYDPPSGWRYGFPKVYRQIKGETLKGMLERDGYPADKSDFASKHCRFYETEVEDTAASVAVEGVDNGWAGFHILPLTAVASIATALDSLPKYGIIYLGSPYSLQADLDEAARLAEDAAAYLMGYGFVVYAPIPHGHAIASGRWLRTEWSFWKRQCEPFIDAAAALVVLKLDGWRDSVGLTYEIARFHEAGKPIVYVTMEDLANG